MQRTRPSEFGVVGTGQHFRKRTDFFVLLRLGNKEDPHFVNTMNDTIGSIQHQRPQFWGHYFSAIEYYDLGYESILGCLCHPARKPKVTWQTRKTTRKKPWEWDGIQKEWGSSEIGVNEKLWNFLIFICPFLAVLASRPHQRGPGC